MTEEVTTPQSLSGTAQETPAQETAQSQEGFQAPKVEKPDWLDDSFYDADKGVKLDELGNKFKELNEFKSRFEQEAEKRKAEMPDNAKEYGYAPKDYKVPEGYKVEENSPMWQLLQETAYEKGLTKSEYNAMATKFIEASNAHQKAWAEGIQAQKAELLKQLGSDASEQVSSLKSWFKATAGDEAVAEQLSETLWTPGIIRFWQRVQKEITSQGAGSFSGLGRDGTGGGEIEGWDKMTFEQKWHHTQQRERRAN